MEDGVDVFGDAIEGKGKYYPMVVLTNKKLMLDETFADFTLLVNNEKVTAHSFIVACRCEEILAMPNDADKKKKVKAKKEVKIKNMPSALIMQKVLEFLYTGMVEFPKLQTLEILQLNAAARHFKLNRLGYLCERWLREHMTMDNVFHLLKGAVDAKETRVKGFCLQYALDHYNEFIANKNGIHILGIDLFQEVVAAFTNRPPPPEEIPPSKAPPDTLLEDFNRMYSLMPFSDAQFNIGNDQIKCHRAILAAHSEAFVPLMKDAPASGVDLQGISSDAFSSLLRFIYYGEDTIDPLPACELVGFSRKFKLHYMLKICEDKIRNSVATDTALAILQTTYLREMEDKDDLVQELRNKTMPFIIENLTDIDLSPIRRMHPNMPIDILERIQKSDMNVAPGASSSNLKASSAAADAPAAAPPPPPRNAPSSSDAPAPPPRSSSSAAVPAPASLPPPVQAPPPAQAPPPLAQVPDPVEAPELSPGRHKSARGSRKSKTDTSKKVDDKKKKEDEKKKKEEEKRVAKEKKEKEKAEKKFRDKKKKDF